MPDNQESWMTNNRRFTEYDRLIESCEILSRVGGRGRRLLRLVSIVETGETRDQRMRGWLEKSFNVAVGAGKPDPVAKKRDFVEF